MTVEPKLLEALAKKLGYSRGHLNKVITARANSMILPREQAALSLAIENGVSTKRYATEKDLADIRHARTGTANAGSEPASHVRESEASRPARRKTSSPSKAAPRKRSSVSKNRVFVVHGRDEKLRKSMFAFLRAIGLSPLEWESALQSTGKASPYIGEVLDSAFDTSAAVVVLLSPDDMARLRDDLLKKGDPSYEANLTGQARPNVLFEAGMAFGRQPDRTVIVSVGSMRPFSDIAGRHTVVLDNSAAKRQGLANRLKTAGCAIDLTGPDWLTTGDFKVKSASIAT